MSYIDNLEECWRKNVKDQLDWVNRECYGRNAKMDSESCINARIELSRSEGKLDILQKLQWKQLMEPISYRKKDRWRY